MVRLGQSYEQSWAWGKQFRDSDSVQSPQVCNQQQTFLQCMSVCHAHSGDGSDCRFGYNDPHDGVRCDCWFGIFCQVGRVLHGAGGSDCRFWHRGPHGGLSCDRRFGNFGRFGSCDAHRFLEAIVALATATLTGASLRLLVRQCLSVLLQCLPWCQWQ